MRTIPFFWGMRMKLYHYVHCPFCVRVRMALGYLNIQYESVVVQYHDEKTPVELSGKKMLPIFKFSENSVMNESLDIIAKLDQQNLLNSQFMNNNSKFEALLDEVGKSVHALCMPYWIWTPEFSPESRAYFKAKKSLKRGPFYKLVQNADSFHHSLNTTLTKIENLVANKKYFDGQKLSILDIALCAHLWGLYIVPEFQFSPAMHQYLQHIKKECRFNYHEDFWKKEEDLF